MNQLHSFAIPAQVGTQEPLDIMSNNQPRISLRNYLMNFIGCSAPIATHFCHTPYSFPLLYTGLKSV